MTHYDPYLQKLLKRASYFSIFVSVILIGVKFIAWKTTHSLSMEATLMDSILDAMASLVNWIAIKHSLKPSDKEHRFGHGKIEALSGVAQSLFISISSLIIFKQCFEHIANPEPLQSLDLGIGVMIFSILLTFALVRYQNFVIKKTQSLAISGDSLHYKSDLLINCGVIFSLLMAHFSVSVAILDSCVAIFIGLYILFTAFTIGKESVQVLMDRELDDKTREKIRKIALNHPQIIKIRSLRTRKSGPFIFIQMDAHMDENLTLKEAHIIAHDIETELLKTFPTALITIHQEAIHHDPISPLHSQKV